MAFDSLRRQFYARQHDFPLHGPRHVLLLPGAGVWVGSQPDSSQPTRSKRVGFIFHPQTDIVIQL